MASEGPFGPILPDGCREETFEGTRIRVVLERPERALSYRWGVM